MGEEVFDPLLCGIYFRLMIWITKPYEGKGRM